MSKTKFGLVIASVAVMSCLALGAQARGGGGGGGGGAGGGGGGAGAGAGAGGGGGGGGSGGVGSSGVGIGSGIGGGGGFGGGHGGISSQAGGMSASHMSDQGVTNTNGFNSLDRDKGLERAEDRSHQRTRASQSTTNYGKHKALGRTK